MSGSAPGPGEGGSGVKKERHISDYSVIAYTPFGIPETHGAASIPIGIIHARRSGEAAAGWIDFAALQVVADSLNAKHRLNDLDEFFLKSIKERRMTPAQAREAFPGSSVHGYQFWSVSAPHPHVTSYSPLEVVPILWHASGGLPLVHLAAWDTRISASESP